LYYAEIQIKRPTVWTFKTKAEESRDVHRDTIDGSMYFDYFVQPNFGGVRSSGM